MSDITRISEGVLLTGRALDLALYAVETAQRSRRRNQLPPLSGLESLRAALSPSGQADKPDGQVGDDVGMEMITTKEAAGLLDCSERQARRLAPMLGGTLRGGRWLVDLGAVREHAEGAQL